MTTLMLTSGFPPVPATRTSNVLDSQHTCGKGLPASFGPCSHTGARAGLEGERAGVGVRQHLQTRRKPGPRDSPTPLSSRPIPREQQRVERITHVLLAARTCSHQREAGTPFCPCRRSPILTCIFPSHPAAPTPGLLTPRRDPPPHRPALHLQLLRSDSALAPVPQASRMHLTPHLPLESPLPSWHPQPARAGYKARPCCLSYRP